MDGTALMFAAKYRQPEVMEAILKQKPQLDLQEKTGATALCVAVQNEHGSDAAAAMVEALLREGAAVDLADFAGRTPLMEAASEGRAAAAEALLRHGSRPELRSRSGQNALEIAIRFASNQNSSLASNPFPSLAQRLEEVTPQGLDLAWEYFASTTTWLYLSSGLAAGICTGFLLGGDGEEGKPSCKLTASDRAD